VSALDPAKILFLDCQTTGMHPSTGHLLEVAWRGHGGERSFLLRLPEGETVPEKVTEITGIRPEDLEAAVDPEVALSALETDLEELGGDAVLIAHYAQFERAFLADLLSRLRDGRPLSWRFLCTFKIARLLHPEVPSRNIRALVGFFELGTTEIRRAAEHARATEKIWRKLEAPLAERGLEGLAAIEAWLRGTKAAKPAKIEYRVDRLRRLALPERPGVYRMIAKDGKVLYVGKATSLHARVNSYFRGKKGPGRRKREMLAQVWDIDVTECGSALEAALLENEEIKRLDPPYNVSLKAGRRKLLFFSRALESPGLAQDEAHPLGPFGRNNAIDPLAQWRAGALEGAPTQIFHDEVPEDVLREGHALFCARHGLTELPGVRSLVALGLWLAREREALLEALESEDAGESGESEEPPDVEEDEAPATPEDVADRYEGLLLRAAWEYLRAKRLTRLLYCRVRLEREERVLELRGGRIVREGSPPPGPRRSLPWAELGLADYDRMSVLLTEVTRCSYPVESLPGS
jgi:DNA polymerase-3 subunit epsilon